MVFHEGTHRQVQEWYSLLRISTLLLLSYVVKIQAK